MPRGVSIHIGLNNLSDYYSNTSFSTLKSCINDMKDMKSIAEANKFEGLLEFDDDKATVHNVKEAIKDYAVGSNKLRNGDLLLITYSGHGSQKRDSFGVEENDYYDESWCLYDMELFDDELFELWTEFNEGVRILVISDSCHSGTILDFLRLGISNSMKIKLEDKGFNLMNFEKEILQMNGFTFVTPNKLVSENNMKILNTNAEFKEIIQNFSKTEYIESVIKTLPASLMESVRNNSKTICDKAKSLVRARLREKLKASNKRTFRQLVKANVLSISACQDNETTSPGMSITENSVFTKALKNAWNNGQFQGNYPKFRDLIREEIRRLPGGQAKPQEPNYRTLNYNADFENQRPFTI